MKNQLQKVKIFFTPCEENSYRPSFLDGRFLLYFTLVLVILKFISLFYFTLLPKTPFFANVSREVLVQLTNNERVTAGLPPLTENPKLIEAAHLKAQNMLRYDYFSHWSPDGLSPWHWFGIAGYDYRYAGENLAMGFLNAKNVHKEWINSPTHRDNILGKEYEEIGIAVVEREFYGQKTFMVVQLFGSKEKEVVNIAPIVEVEEIIKPEVIITEEEIVIPKEEIIVNEGIVVEKGVIIEEGVIIEDGIVVEEAVVLGQYDTGLYLSANNIKSEGLKFSLFKFLMLEYDNIFQQLVFFSMIFLGFILIINVFVKFNVQHPDLIFKGLSFLALFLIFGLFDQITIMRMLIGTPLIG